jgi:hypothetical protein
MKKLLIPVLLLSLSINIFSQDDDGEEFQTLFGENGTNGGYGAFSFGYAAIAKKDAAVFGGQGAWILSHYLAIGIGGNGFASNLNSDTSGFAGGYGGFLIEPIVLPLFPVHISLPILVGAGAITKTKSTNYPYSSTNSYVVDSDPFFFVKPGMEIELNLTRHMRLALGAFYMYTSKINIQNTKSNALNDFSGAVTLKFGKF